VYDGVTVDFERVLRILAGFFDANGAPWGVIGGLAMAAHGSPRTTLDVDVVADSALQEPLVEFLESLGFETLHRSSGYSNHLHEDADLGRIDVVYVRGGTSREIFVGAKRHPGPGGLEIPVPRPEHLAAMKAYAIKNDPTRTLRELADIRDLLDVPDVDRAEVERYFERYGLEALLERLDES
jgi:hypothetical protein